MGRAVKLKGTICQHSVHVYVGICKNRLSWELCLYLTWQFTQNVNR